MIFRNNNPKRQQPKTHVATDTERIAQDFMAAKLEQMQQAYYHTDNTDLNEEIENKEDHEINQALDCLLNDKIDQQPTISIATPPGLNIPIPNLLQTNTNTTIETAPAQSKPTNISPPPEPNQTIPHTHAHYENPQLLDDILSSIVDTHIQKQTKRLKNK